MKTSSSTSRPTVHGQHAAPSASFRLPVVMCYQKHVSITRGAQHMKGKDTSKTEHRKGKVKGPRG